MLKRGGRVEIWLKMSERRKGRHGFGTDKQRKSVKLCCRFLRFRGHRHGCARNEINEL